MGAIVDQLDLNDVALLVRVVQAGSFSEAARERGVPVSTVSRRIARLEERLAVRLLERTTRKLRLTDTGRTYFEHAERALEELGQGAHRLREIQEVPRGRVRMTAPVAMGGAIVRTAASFLRANAMVNLDLDLSDRRVDLLGEGYDLALRAGAVEGSDLVARKLWEAHYRIFASPTYFGRRKRPRTLRELRACDCIALRSSESGSTWNLYNGARRERFTFVPRLVANELSVAKDATLAGIGVAMLPAPSCEIELERGELERVLPAYVGGPGAMWIVYPARRSLTAAVRAFIEHLRAALPTPFSDAARASKR